MEPSFFLKCEKCDSKPATIRLTNGVQEKKICFQCERDLTREPFYKEWTKQFIPYSELKGSNAANRVDNSRQLSSTAKQDIFMRSPQSTPNTNRNYSQSITRDRSNRPTENLIIKSPSGQLDNLRRSSYNLETVSPRVGIGKRSYDIGKLQVETENRPSSGLIRHNREAGTPSKFGFFSEYLKDFNPKATDFKSPTGRAVKKNILEKTTRTYSSSSFLSPAALSGFESVKHERERERNTANPEHYKTTPLTESVELSSTSARPEKLSVNTRFRDRNYDTAPDNRHETRHEPRHEARQDARQDDKLISGSLEKKTRDLRKDEIRNRMSKLSEQFYSPKRSPPKHTDESKPFVTQESSITEYRERRHFKSAAQEAVNRSSFKNQITEAEILGAMRTEPAEDKITLQNYENNVANLKAHIENIEKRNGETIRQLREELKTVREELLKERTENSSGYNKDTASLKSKIEELERRLKDESGKNRIFEEKLDQNKGSLEKKLADTKEELERTRKEKDRRIEELSNQIRTLNKSNRETIEQTQRENEGFINKLKSEYEVSTLRHPFLVNMMYAFQDRENLYLVMELMPGGDLRYHISKKRRFTEEQTKFFICCITLGLEYLHMNGIIHRDIKPENLVLDHKGYVRITDLGIARVWRPENSSDTSGTPGYMAPEVMCRQNHGVAVDYFAMGVMAYEFMMGRRPYQGRSRKEIRDQILAKQVQIKKHEVPEGWSLEAADFVNRLIQRKPANRLGVNGPSEIKSHPWIKDYPWEKLNNQELEAPFIPNQDEDNFDRRQQITQEATDPEVAKQNALMLRRNSVQSLFDGYHYDGTNITPAKDGMMSQRTNSTSSFSGKTSVLY